MIAAETVLSFLCSSSGDVILVFVNFIFVMLTAIMLSWPIHNKVNFDKREKLVFMIKTLASVDELLKRSISSVVSVSEVIAGKSPPITMYMLRYVLV